MMMFSKKEDNKDKVRAENLSKAWAIMNDKLSHLTKNELIRLLRQIRENYAFPGLNQDSSSAELILGMGLIALTQGASAVARDVAAKIELPDEERITNENCQRIVECMLADPKMSDPLKVGLIKELLNAPELNLSDNELLDGFRKSQEIADEMVETAGRFQQKL